jgi:hypothetical protein
MLPQGEVLGGQKMGRLRHNNNTKNNPNKAYTDKQQQQ